jgi:glutamine synthetase
MSTVSPLEGIDLPSADQVATARARLEEAGVQYVLACWIDLLGIPKTKPVPMSEFEALCAGRGPQFAVHSVAMFPELGPADPDQTSTASWSARGTSATRSCSPTSGSRASPTATARAAR